LRFAGIFGLCVLLVACGGGGDAVLMPSGRTTLPPGAGYGADEFLFSDDFSDADGAWGIGSFPEAEIGYESEKLAIDLTKDTGYMVGSLQELHDRHGVLRVEATVQSSGGDGSEVVGMTCGETPDDGVGAVVGEDLVAFVRVQGNENSVLDLTDGLDLLDDNEPAEVRLECADTNDGHVRLKVWFNGIPVAEYDGREGLRSFNSIQFYMEGAAGSTFTFDDLVVYGGEWSGLTPMPDASENAY